MNLKGETQLPKPAPRQVDPQILALASLPMR